MQSNPLEDDVEQAKPIPHDAETARPAPSTERADEQHEPDRATKRAVWGK